MDQVIIYTDGACSRNPGPGGWGCVLISGAHRKEANGCAAETTNDRMELTAAIEALRMLKRSCSVNLYTDSAYLCNAFEKGWLDQWRRNGWKTTNRHEVENRDLWEQLDALCVTHIVRFHKVKGHSDNVENNRCDKLAREAIKSLQNKEKPETAEQA